MACQCAEQIDEKLATRNGRLAFGFSFSRADGMANGVRHVPVLIETEKLASRGKTPPLVIATFCPFCGLKYDTES